MSEEMNDIDMGTERVLIQPLPTDTESWGFKKPCYLLKMNRVFITVEEDGHIYRIPWTAICYVRNYEAMGTAPSSGGY